MPKFTIDGIDYNSEDLSDFGRAQLASLQFLEFQMRKIKDDLRRRRSGPPLRCQRLNKGLWP
jgi:hypothetical protein